MAPEPPNQKRKRGRPPVAPKIEDAPSRDPQQREADNENRENDDVDNEAQERPRKRGRKKREDVAEDPAPAAQDTAQPARRGRPAKATEQSMTEENDAAEGKPHVRGDKANTQPRKQSPKGAKGKNKATRSKEVAVEEGAPSSSARRSQRERRSWDPERIFSGQRGNNPKEPEEAQEESRPRPKSKKSGRPSLDDVPVSEAQNQQATSTKEAREKKNRGRQSLNKESIETTEQVAQAKQPKQRKVPVEVTEDQPSGAKEASQTGHRGRKKASAAPEVEERPPPEEDGLQPRRRGRLKASGGPEAEKRPPSPTEDAAQSRRRGRPKVSNIAEDEERVPSRAEDAPQPRRKGRPTASKVEASEQREVSGAEPAERGMPQRPNGKSEEAARVPKQPKPRSRQAEPEPVQPAAPEVVEAPVVTYRCLKEGTRSIPRSTISAKWTPLDGPSINTVQTFLADAQRPVLLRLQDTNRRREFAESALSVVSRRLRSKLVKGFPFPAHTAGPPSKAAAGSHEAEFDFERTVDAIQSLENNLNPLLHSVSLLEREIQKEEAALELEHSHLQKLEANARSETKAWRERGKRDHVLAPGMKRHSEQDDMEAKDVLELVSKGEDGITSGLFKDLQDEELVLLLKQTGSHMESMKTNLQQIDGVVPAITKSKAALQQVLHKHLGEEEYERVLLG